MSEEKSVFEGWAILELMGHRRLAGYLQEAQLGGASFIRIDVPGSDGEGNVATQMYSPAAVYCITPTTEAIARKAATSSQPAPVTAWELRPERTLPAPRRDINDDDDDDDDYDDERESA